MSVPFCPYHFVQCHFVRVPFCPYHFVRYHFVRSPHSASVPLLVFAVSYICIIIKTNLTIDADCHDSYVHVLYALNFVLQFVGVVRWLSVSQEKHHVTRVRTHSILRVEQSLPGQTHSTGHVRVLCSESQSTQVIDNFLYGRVICEVKGKVSQVTCAKTHLCEKSEYLRALFMRPNSKAHNETALPSDIYNRSIHIGLYAMHRSAGLCRNQLRKLKLAKKKCIPPKHERRGGSVASSVPCVRRLDSNSSHPVVTLAKSFTRSCL